MGQYMKNPIHTRLEWLGDMEPEYEEMLEWLCLIDEVGNPPHLDAMPVSWVVMANALGTCNAQRLGM
ncbi:MAG: hypothetical protein HQM03_01835 [Magnetococcales bacterium]|nr:hypothetical protein [Magnetococcales bacterium]